MFGHDSQPSKIYKYGCLPPAQGAEAVAEQMLLAHRYRNDLVAAELDRRAQWKAILLGASPGIAAMEEAIRSGEEELARACQAEAAERAERRSKKAGPAAALKKQIAAVLKANRADLKRLRLDASKRPDVAAALADLAAADSARKKALRKASGLYWGTYLAVEQAAASMGRGSPPKFHRFTGGGRIAVQVQKGLTPAQLADGDDSRCRLILTGRVGRGGRPLGEFWLRAKSDGADGPVWCVLPFVYHRPLPEASRLKWAYLHRRRCGTRWRWDLSLVVSRGDGWPLPDAAADGAVGIHVGYRETPDGLLVATWAGSDGDEGRLVIPTADLDRWAGPDARRADRDRVFNAHRDILADWVRDNPAPDWLREATATIRQWRSQGRMAGVAIRWRDNRFDGDGEAFDTLESWRRADAREWDSEAGQRARAIRWRDDLYRNFVAGLRRRYRLARVRAVDYAKLARLPADRFVPEAVRRNRFVAAPGRLAELIKEGFAECEAVEIPPEREADGPVGGSAKDGAARGARRNSSAGAELVY